MLYVCQSEDQRQFVFLCICSVTSFPCHKEGRIRKGGKNLTLGCLSSTDWSAQSVYHTTHQSHLANLQQMPEPTPLHLHKVKDFLTHRMDNTAHGVSMRPHPLLGRLPLAVPGSQTNLDYKVCISSSCIMQTWWNKTKDPCSH